MNNGDRVASTFNMQCGGVWSDDCAKYRPLCTVTVDPVPLFPVTRYGFYDRLAIGQERLELTCISSSRLVFPQTAVALRLVHIY